jgi:hypothetical protein
MVCASSGGAVGVPAYRKRIINKMAENNAYEQANDQPHPIATLKWQKRWWKLWW